MTTYFVSPDGDDSSDGSAKNPFRTLMGAVYPSPVQHLRTRLLPGDTVKIRPGVYRIADEPRDQYGSWLLTRLQGGPTAPITICAAEDSDPPIFTGSDPTFESIKTEAWEVVTEDGLDGRKIFRSTSTLRVKASDVQKFRGFYNDRFALVPYSRFIDFASDNTRYHRQQDENAHDEQASLYVGPGLFFKPLGEEIPGEDGLIEGHLYVRLMPTFTQQHLELADRDIDPNRVPLRICSTADELILRSCSNLRLAHLRLADPGRIRIGASNHWNPSRHLELFKLEIPRGALTAGGNIISIGPRCHDVQVLKCRINGGFPPWIYWTDVKHGVRSGELGPARGFHGGCVGLNSSAVHTGRTSIADDGASHVEVDGCALERAFFGVALGHGANRVTVQRNHIRNIHDDAILVTASAYEVDIFNNRITESFAGISSVSGVYETDAEAVVNRVPPRKLGTIYIHHNVIHTGPVAYGRIGAPQAYLGLPEDREALGDEARERLGGFVDNRPFGAHGYLPEAWTIYNNTLVFRSVHACGALHLNPHSEVPEYFFNNLVVQLYPQGKVLWNIDVTRQRLGGKRQIADGNVYWRSQDLLSDEPALVHFGNSDVAGFGQRSFRDLLQFFSGMPGVANYFERSRRYHDLRFEEFGYQGDGYTAGFDAGSLWGQDPELDLSSYRPRVGGPADRRGIALDKLGCARDWPMRNSGFIGALKPR